MIHTREDALRVDFFVGVWYAAFGVCHWIVKIPVFYEVLAALAAVVATLVILGVVISLIFVAAKE